MARLVQNLPNQKPELWRNLPGSVLRKIRLEWSDLPPTVIRKLPNGLKMQVDPNDAIGRSIYLYGCYEYAVTELIEDTLRADSTFFDIGANVGYYTLLAASRCKKVVSFEPVPEIHDVLAANIQRNNLQNVMLDSCAVGEREGLLKLYIPTGEGNSGLASLEKCENASPLEVSVVTLDEEVRRHSVSHIDLIKIDIEGAEVRAFEGGKKLLSSDRAPDVIFEAHPTSSASEWLRDHGYSIHRFKRERSYEAPNLFASKRALTEKLRRHLRD